MSDIYIAIPYPTHSGNHQRRNFVTASGKMPLTEETKAYRAQVHALLYSQRQSDLKLAGPLEVQWLVNPPDRRARDTANLIKTVEDAITKAGFWLDDSNRVIRRTMFEWAEPVKGGRIQLWARPWVDLGNEP